MRKRKKKKREILKRQRNGGTVGWFMRRWHQAQLEASEKRQADKEEEKDGGKAPAGRTGRGVAAEAE